MVLIFCIVSSGSVTNFFPTVVETLNYGKIETLLLTAPPYALAVITTFLNAWHADRTGERYFHVTIPPLRLRRGVHHRSRDDQHGAALSVDDADGPGHVLGLCGGARLDLEHAATPAGEACCCARGHQRRQQHEQYLCQLHVSAERGTTIWYVSLCFRSFFFFFFFFAIAFFCPFCICQQVCACAVHNVQSCGAQQAQQQPLLGDDPSSALAGFGPLLRLGGACIHVPAIRSRTSSSVIICQPSHSNPFQLMNPLPNAYTLSPLFPFNPSQKDYLLT